MLNVGFLVLMSKMPVREVTQDEFTQGLLKWASCVRWEFGLTLLRLEKVCYMELHVGLRHVAQENWAVKKWICLNNRI